MIIIKISILYFIQIRHADDFPSTGTRLVYTGMANSVGPSPEDFICVCVYNPLNPSWGGVGQFF